LGESVIGGTSDELLQATFSVGLKGIQKGKNKEVEDLILESLTRLANDGFHEDAIRASVNTIEFRLRKSSERCFQYGCLG
jgi:Zn-dependent M16 (insulinase) family peptidase